MVCAMISGCSLIALDNWAAGKQSYDARDFDEAVHYYSEAVRLKPDDAFYHVSLAQALVAQGDDDAAIEQYREAVHFESNTRLRAAWHSGLGRLLEKKGDLAGAVGEFREVDRLLPNEPGVRKQLDDLLQKIAKDGHGPSLSNTPSSSVGNTPNADGLPQ